MNSKHTFAFYCPNLSSLAAPLTPGQTLSFKDAELWNRLVTITRIRANEEFILFDDTNNIKFSAQPSMITDRRFISATLVEQHTNERLRPEITLYCPILKKDALENVVYVAAQVGVTTIVPISTQKTHDSEISQKEIERLKTIMLAACEQAKQFVPPVISNALPLSQAIEQIQNESCSKIMFDENGAPLANLAQSFTQAKPSKIYLTFGPESGFTTQEIELLHTAGLQSYKLTPTILRSREAATIGLGILRSL